MSPAAVVATRRLGCSPAWVRRLVDDGLLPALRTTTGQRLVRADALEALAVARESGDCAAPRSRDGAAS